MKVKVAFGGFFCSVSNFVLYFLLTSLSVFLGKKTGISVSF
ncbi:hypothetical protein [Lactococcus lactis]|nr:hypothetical protein [Lactococcus lactis]KST81604.1 hypothetical protein LK337_2325 [Lactococcus lactis subsp. lactis]